MKFSLDEFIKAAVGLAPLSRSAATYNGTGIDRKEFEEALVVVNAGTNEAGGTVAITVSDSADNSTFAAVSGAAFTSITTANDNNIYVGRLNLVGLKRYIRVNAVVAVAACLFSVDVILGAAKQLPVSQENTSAFTV